MRYVRFAYRETIGYGVIVDKDVVDLAAAYCTPEDAIVAMHRGEIDLSDVSGASQLAMRDICFLPPVENGRYFCVGYNYHDHRDELNSPSGPVTVFVRNPASVVGHNVPVVHSKATRCFDFEGELAVVIGASGRATDVEQALGMIAGYTCFMDGSARDYQKESVGAGKNFDASGAVGPWVRSARSVADPQQLVIETRVNDEVMQHASTSDMIATVAEILIYISSFADLRAGDVIATGTPSGVGMSRVPPRWLVPGNRIEVEISSVGTLANQVIGAVSS